ncbi:hypothetical protein J1605_011778 [Eschrichtius robustus]|uniref:Uncharacterized protein n=1 Tax=Eschrichtius robustus TaxID=9764 RepID=A0AB34GND0_ESCRO|nr:hypothetical protein J1605_011778 [Eschrichtius robustus]
MNLICKKMNPLWFFLFLVSAPRGVLSQVQLQESGPSLVSCPRCWCRNRAQDY